MKFEKKNIAVARGMQPTKYDFMLEHLVEPGDSLMFEESELSRPAASQAAKRMMILDPTRKFHSFYNVVEKKVVVRVRPQGETGSEGEEKEEEKPETYAQFLEREKSQAVDKTIESTLPLD